MINFCTIHNRCKDLCKVENTVNNIQKQIRDTDNSNESVFIPQRLQIQEQVPSGTGTNSPMTGQWNTRFLNTIILNEISDSIIIHNNGILLPKGTYIVHAVAPSWKLGATRLQLWDRDTLKVLLTGNSAYSGDTFINIVMNGEIILDEDTPITLKQYVEKGITGWGLGYPTNLGINEIYSELFLIKIK